MVRTGQWTSQDDIGTRCPYIYHTSPRVVTCPGQLVCKTEQRVGKAIVNGRWTLAWGRDGLFGHGHVVYEAWSIM